MSKEILGAVFFTLTRRFAGIERNHEFGEAIEASAQLVRVAQHSVKVVSGVLNKQFYTDPRLIQAFRESLEKNVYVQIITGPDPQKDSLETLASLRSYGKIKIYQLADRPTGHFMVVDDKHVRVEEFHAPDQEKRRGWVKRDTLILGHDLGLRFAGLLARAAKISRMDPQP